jgi:hypothetical protein
LTLQLYYTHKTLYFGTLQTSIATHKGTSSAPQKTPYLWVYIQAKITACIYTQANEKPGDRLHYSERLYYCRRIRFSAPVGRVCLGSGNVFRAEYIAVAIPSPAAPDAKLASS